LNEWYGGFVDEPKILSITRGTFGYMDIFYEE
jgi:hypothetical protein